ncbi:hypothetical protein PAPYR_13065 [Paratrimastix pyriformis]|uniref:Uncharacterized protein n=1 Tax=Paratrimastix pyriformis TaxID=342808 RepID=A0ABQ8U340_9EUKA|nr:hypothetical protein PAPYR_13065 [Paratrimastix pyriformis]
MIGCLIFTRVRVPVSETHFYILPFQGPFVATINDNECLNLAGFENILAGDESYIALSSFELDQTIMGLRLSPSFRFPQIIMGHERQILHQYQYEPWFQQMLPIKSRWGPPGAAADGGQA